MSTPETAGTGRFVPCVSETFFQAQQRNRRATWRMSALCLFAAFLMGIPLTLVLTPFLYAVGMAIAEVINHFAPLPPEFWQGASDLTHFAYRVANALFNQQGTVDVQDVALTLALVLLPGIVFALSLWAGILLLFRRAGVGGAIASLNAREPSQTDLKELQFMDAVQEMAIASGLPAPKVMLIDSPGANSSAIGTSPQDAHIVVSRRLLDDLNRDELEALIAHLVASVGNGDLRIAFTVTSVFETCGLILALINAPFGRQSRSKVWRIIGFALRPGTADAKSADEMAALLADTVDMDSSDIDRFFNSGRPGLIRKLLRLVFFPLQFTNLAIELTLWFFLSVLLGPCMALLWRTRRYLADAGAVELTRNPDALATALQRLSADSTAVAGGSWATHLFVVNPGGDRSLRGMAPGADQQRKFVEAWRAAQNAGGAAPVSNVAPIRMDPQDFSRFRQEMKTTAMAAAAGDAAAVARLEAFAHSMGVDAALGLTSMPNPQDIILAQRGDRAALARIRALRPAEAPEARTRRGQTGLQNDRYISFHPPLDKRVKRLQKMGAHLVTPAKRGSILGKILFAILYLILGPLLVLAGVMMLFVIALMIGLNLIFLTLWLSVIHWAFAQDWGSNFRAFMDFVQQVSAAVNKGR